MITIRRRLEAERFWVSVRVKGGVLNGPAKPAKPMAAKRVLEDETFGQRCRWAEPKSFKGQPCGELRQRLPRRLSVERLDVRIGSEADVFAGTTPVGFVP